MKEIKVNNLEKAFCNFELLNSNIIPRFFDCGSCTNNEILRIYAKWHSELLRKPQESGNRGVTYEYISSLNDRYTIISDGIQGVTQNTLGGIDFPVWFKGFERFDDPGKSLRLMIVGQDPLRRKNDYQQGKFPIGTPFAVHNQWMREGRTKMYWDIFESCLKEGDNLYITDLNKVFFHERNTPKFFSNADVFNKILKEECDLYRPDAIITFGKLAFDALGTQDYKKCFVDMGVLDDGELRKTKNIMNKEGKGFPLIPLIHPSGMARGHRPRFFQANKDKDGVESCSIAEFLKKFLSDNLKNK